MSLSEESNQCLRLCLCIEDVDLCIVLINQICSGQVFGQSQPLNLMLHGTDTSQLRELQNEIQDCAFPLVKGISIHSTLQDIPYSPDIILIILSNWHREQIQQLYNLVTYIHRLAESLSPIQLKDTMILLTGDLALTAAAILSKKLSFVPASQFFAIDRTDFTRPDGYKTEREAAKQTLHSLDYDMISRITNSIGHWWSGLKKNSDEEMLGLKYMDTKQDSNSFGYFFMTGIEITGPRTFNIKHSFSYLDPYHVNEVKAVSDQAFELANQMEMQQDGSNYDKLKPIKAQL